MQARRKWMREHKQNITSVLPWKYPRRFVRTIPVNSHSRNKNASQRCDVLSCLWICINDCNVVNVLYSGKLSWNLKINSCQNKECLPIYSDNKSFSYLSSILRSIFFCWHKCWLEWRVRSGEHNLYLRMEWPRRGPGRAHGREDRTCCLVLGHLFCLRSLMTN